MDSSDPVCVYVITTAGRLYVGRSTTPLERVHCHNRVPGYRSAPRHTRTHTPWRLLMVCVPPPGQAKRVQQQWQQHTHTVESAVLFGSQLRSSTQPVVLFSSR